jgi:hypothetical protein
MAEIVQFLAEVRGFYELRFGDTCCISAPLSLVISAIYKRDQLLSFKRQRAI